MELEVNFEEKVEDVTIPDRIKKDMTAVLSEYVRLGVIGRAFDCAGVSRKCHLEWLEKYPIYKERFNECKDKFVDGLETIAIERAKEKSDSLMTLMLKSHRPETYGDRSEVNLKSNMKPIQLIFAESMLTEEEKKILQGSNEDE
jgi:hypothetical protein